MTVQNSFQTEVGQQAMRDFVERMQNPQQALEDVRIENEANCTIGAGYPLDNSTEGSTTDSQRIRQQLRILVSGELCQMLEDCNLGAGLPDAIQVGRQRLSQRLKQPSADVQQLLTTALDDALAPDEGQDGIPDSARSKVRSAICSVLSEQDWEAISTAAAMAIQQNLKRQIASDEGRFRKVA